MRSPDREVIPAVLNAGDRCAQDEGLHTPGSYENCLRYSWPRTSLSDPASWDREERRFHAAYLAVLGGLRPWNDGELLGAARALGVDGPRHHDARPGRVAPVQVGDEVLCDVVEDAVPELMMLLERVTGQPGMPARPAVGAVAVLGFAHCGIEGTRPVEGWMDESRGRRASSDADSALVRAVRVIDDAPMGVWVDAVALVPIVPALCPLPLDPIWARLPRAFAGRPYKISGGAEGDWAFSCLIPLPAPAASTAPAEQARRILTRRLDLELWDLRRTERRATFEDVLRQRPEVVARAAAEMSRAPSWLGHGIPFPT